MAPAIPNPPALRPSAARTPTPRLGRGAPPEPRSRWRTRLLALLIAFALVELGARVAWNVLPRAQRASYGYPTDLYVWNPVTEYGLRPGYEGTFTGIAYERIPIVINAHGYRDRPFQEERTPGVARIAFLGDSVTFGAGIPAEARYTDALVNALDDEPVETLNLAVNSFNLFHYREQMRHVVPRWRPDVVVVGFCLNDIEPPERCWPREYVRSPDGRHVGALTREPPLWQRFARSFALARLTKDLLRRLEEPRGAEHWERWMRGLTDAAWKDVALLARLRADLAQVQDDARELGARLLVLVLPERNDLEHRDGRFALPRATLLRVLEDLAIEALDPHAAFQALPDLDAVYLPGDSVHFSPAGHANLARMLGERLRERS